MNSEAHWFLTRRADQTGAAFFAALQAVAALAAAPDVQAELVELVPSDALSALPHMAESTGGEAGDAILALAGPLPALQAAVARVAPHLREACDGARSSVLGLRRFSILPGSDRIKLFFGLRRLDSLTRPAFLSYWLDVHAEFGRRLIPPYSYHQLHAEADLTQQMAELSGLAPSTLDGIAEVHFPDLEALIAQLSRPAVATDALADERTFIDHARSVFRVFRTPDR